MQLIPQTEFVVRYTEREFAVVTKALALMAEVPGPPSKAPSPEDRAEAAALNKAALEQQEAVYSQRLRSVRGKQLYAEEKR